VDVSLPNDIARCPGQTVPAGPEAAWPFPERREDCLGCARRTEGIRDYLAGARVAWMHAPQEFPCSEKLEPKK
jgi:hypothetical protein